MHAQMQTYLLWLEQRGLLTLDPRLYGSKPRKQAVIFGARTAKVVVVLGCPQAGMAGPLGEEEKDLLRKLLQAMKLNVGSEVCYVQMNNAGLDELADLVAEVKPQVLLSFGELNCMGEKTKNIWIAESGLGAPLVAMHHPRDLVAHPPLKRETWSAAQQVMANLK